MRHSGVTKAKKVHHSISIHSKIWHFGVTIANNVYVHSIHQTVKNGAFWGTKSKQGLHSILLHSKNGAFWG